MGDGISQDRVPPWSLGHARQILNLFLRARSGDPDEFETVYFVGNATFRNPATDYCLKIYSSASLEQVTQIYAFAREMINRGFSCIEPVEDITPQPVEIEGRVLAAWRWIDIAHDAQIDLKEFGQLLQQFHFLSLDMDLTFPSYFVFKERFDFVSEAPAQDRMLLSTLRARFIQTVEEMDNYESALGCGVIHGDAHLNNVVQGKKATMIDLDTVAHEWREWDLVPVAVANRRFGLTNEQYQLFVDGYGFDLFEWEGADSMITVREMLQAIWLYRSRDVSERYYAAALHRIKSIIKGEAVSWVSF